LLTLLASGHNNGGSSSTEGGMVIDLSRHLNNVHIDPEASVAVIGGGTLWSKLDEEAATHGLATVGPVMNEVGVAG
jgi:FAD/FMN-containing dehydrogenase